MGLESATYISGLVATNPINATDVVGEGDDHIRLLKTTILNSFPGITGAMTMTHTQLNDAAIKGEANTFTADQTIDNASPRLLLNEDDQGADAKLWDIRVGTSDFSIRTRTDADAVGESPLTISRSGTAVSAIDLQATNIRALAGSTVRVFDSTDTDYVQLSHDGTSALLDFATTTSLDVRGGVPVRFMDSGNTDYLEVQHDGTDMLLTGTNTGSLQLIGLTGLDIRDGASLVLRDAADTDSLTLAHDGTDLNGTFVNTTAWNLADLTRLWLRDGAALRISDSADTDYIDISHDGTDVQIACTNTDMIRSNADFYVRDTTPAYYWDEQDAGSDEKVWRLIANGDSFKLQTRTDADGTGADALEFTRTGTNLNALILDVDTLNSQDATLTTDNLDASEPGYKGTPQKTKVINYTLNLVDAGTQIYLPSGSGKTVTIPANSSVAFPIGTIIIIINDSGNDWDIAINTDTLEEYGGTTGTQTLTDNNKAVLEKVTSTLWKYSSTD